MEQVLIPKGIDEAINFYNEIGQDNHIAYITNTIANREGISLQDALKMYEAICEKIGNKDTQAVYAVLRLADYIKRK